LKKSNRVCSHSVRIWLGVASGWKNEKWLTVSAWTKRRQRTICENTNRAWLWKNTSLKTYGMRRQLKLRWARKTKKKREREKKEKNQEEQKNTKKTKNLTQTLKKECDTNLEKGMCFVAGLGGFFFLGFLFDIFFSILLRGPSIPSAQE